MNLEQARFFMVEQQIRPWDVLDPKILDLLMDLPRHLFVEECNEALAYADIELPLAHGQSMMSPKVEARLLQALDIDSQDNVLEIGTGSGYLTALMASLGQHVTTVELYPDLQAIVKNRLTSFKNIEFKEGDGSLDWPDEQMYDVIVLTGSVDAVPQTYKEKLNLGGRLAVVVGQAPAMSAQLITRISESEWETEFLFETDLTPLVNAHAKPKFTF
ncbi:protein-L-isoaspartate O-methyltransferase family protein [Thiomicrorhabdus aquaedulcis]|uniref:protein-L-isoaspartate O-methyltransferase family protein n=1 Tax=Thiomicrorhabdus aquaedulcis TaxID=2211106 RepID=UPI000FDA8C4C|nr:protein-L-isoaspartate O-methyltransferase [Thiomicrorhabdus aquaedulcis]